MDGFALSLIPIYYNDKYLGKYLFEPPTVRQAVILYELLPHWEDPSCLVRLQKILYEWLGSCGLLQRLEDLKIGWKASRLLFETILISCEPKIEKEEKKEAAEWVRKSSFSLMIAEYRHWFNADPLDEPWPYFLAQYQEIHKLKSEVGLSTSVAFIAGNSADAHKELIKLAGYKRPERQIEFYDDAEYNKEQEDRARVMRMMITGNFDA